MKRLAAVLLILVPVSLFVAGCGGGVTNPPKSLKPEEMKMPPDMAKKFQKGPPSKGVNK